MVQGPDHSLLAVFIFGEAGWRARAWLLQRAGSCSSARGSNLPFLNTRSWVDPSTVGWWPPWWRINVGAQVVQGQPDFGSSRSGDLGTVEGARSPDLRPRQPARWPVGRSCARRKATTLFPVVWAYSAKRKRLVGVDLSISTTLMRT